MSPRALPVPALSAAVAVAVLSAACTASPARERMSARASSPAGTDASPATPEASEAGFRGAWDYLYPDHPSGRHRPVTLPVDESGPWRLRLVADYGVFDLVSCVVATAPGSAWAFGTDGRWRGRLVALRWDGTRWTRYAWDRRADPVAAAASGPDDVWLLLREAHRGQVLHWDGVRWAPVGGGASFFRLGSAGRGRAWALNGRESAVWLSDGGPWRRVPGPGAGIPQVLSVSASGTYWAINDDRRRQGLRTALYRGAPGGRWQPVAFGGALPKDTAENSLQLQGVVAASDADVWAYGTYGTRPDPEEHSDLVRHPVAAHWDGRAWRAVAVPNGWRFTDAAVPDGRGGLRVVVASTTGDEDAVEAETAVLSLTPAGLATPAGPRIPGGRVVLRGLARVPGTHRFWAVGAAFPAATEMSASTSVIYGWRPSTPSTPSTP
ncbi:hypothetical protein OG320_01130 [Microbispora sp. NBC_01189]|uniref:hypothetical protein n=1 Tax=Microbispora sp. NBC_01189 TaxID=2903583 RepID=UPI002E0F3939|nr:hypothetical protein OG320_01130 [Microbispora sp. NBC_01189]